MRAGHLAQRREHHGPGAALAPSLEHVLDQRRTDALALGGFILAPQGPLTLQDATVMTHQISVRIPIR